MEKTDLSKTYKAYYSATTRPQILDIGPAAFLSISGKGDPSSALFEVHIRALYTVAYTLKFQWKAAGKDFVVAKLEGLWTFDEEKYGSTSIIDAPTRIPRSEWEYRLLLRLPDFVTPSSLEEAREAALRKKKTELVRQVVWFEQTEGRVVQVLHKGPFDTEPKTLLELQRFMEERGLQRNGLHHEIYLSDFRTTAPEKLRTILREPVKGG